MRGLESTRTPQEIAVTHSLSTAGRRLRRYGCIVVTGVGDAEAIGETVGTGCSRAIESGVDVIIGDMVGIGDVGGAGDMVGIG